MWLKISKPKSPSLNQSLCTEKIDMPIGRRETYLKTGHCPITRRSLWNSRVAASLKLGSSRAVSHILAPLLGSAKKQKQFTKETKKLGAELKKALHMSLGEVNDRTVDVLKTVSKAEVGINVKKIVTDTWPMLMLRRRSRP